MTRKLPLLFISIVLITGSILANITGWRTDNTGKYPDADPPLSWDREKNLVWKTPLPSSSNATPVIAGDKIFVCSDTARLICISKSNGKILWQKNNEYKDVLPAEEYKKAREDMKKANEISNKELLCFEKK